MFLWARLHSLLGHFTKCCNRFCSTAHRFTLFFVTVFFVDCLCLSFAKLICFWETNQNFYCSSSASFCIRLVGKALWLVFCCVPAQDRALAKCTIFFRHARACRCKPQRGNKPLLSMSLSVASSLTFWEQCIPAGIFPRGEPTELARLVMLDLPSFSVAGNCHLSFYPTFWLVLPFHSFPSLLPHHSSYFLPSTLCYFFSPCFLASKSNFSKSIVILSLFTVSVCSALPPTCTIFHTFCLHLSLCMHSLFKLITNSSLNL